MSDAAEAAACRRLWSAVALLAISDADLDPLGPAGAYLRSHDFRMVCDLAGLDAEAAVARVNAMRRERIAAAQREAEMVAGSTATPPGGVRSPQRQKRKPSAPLSLANPQHSPKGTVKCASVAANPSKR